MKSVHKINANVLILALLLIATGVIRGQKSEARVTTIPVSRLPAAVPTTAQIKPIATEAPAFAKLEADLQLYMALESRAEKNPAQVAVEREKLLKNASLLRSLRGFLSRPAIDAREAAEQNAGFALLLEAAHGEQSEVASETLRMVVADEEMDDILNDGSRHSGASRGESDELSGLTPSKLWQSAHFNPGAQQEEAAAISN